MKTCSSVFFLFCFFKRLGCGAGQCRWSAARHAHISHCSQEVCLLVQRTVPLPGRTVRATGPREEVPTQPASVPRHGLCATTVGVADLQPACLCSNSENAPTSIYKNFSKEYASSFLLSVHGQKCKITCVLQLFNEKQLQSFSLKLCTTTPEQKPIFTTC